ncbi:MAG: DNA invertase Pin-like site-specific DNA recombinase [Verrucomicrobiales bacterium]|jgi:DNA invertase Pin-like site-specific DNA recombinase
MPRAKHAAYIRVSTADQKTDPQRAEIAAWAKSHRMKIEWYEDKISGKRSTRPGLDALRKDIFSGKIKTVIVWKLDRLARSKRDGETMLADWCGKGVRVVSITQAIDLSGVVGQIVASVLLGLGEIELENIRERQASGIAVAKKRGVYEGRKAGTTKGEPKRAAELREKGLKIEVHGRFEKHCEAVFGRVS